MTRGRSNALLALVVGVTLGSCAIRDFDASQAGGEPSGGGSGGSGAVSSGGGIALEDAAAVLAAAMCSKFVACVGRAALKVLLFDEECAVSVERGLANTAIANIQQSVEAGTIVYDGSAVPACLEAYAALPCEEVAISFPEACKQALGGLRPEGGDCAHTHECEAGLYCTTGACPGTCSTPLQQGDPCIATDVCAPGLTCFQDECAPLGGEGDDCGTNLLPPCVTGFVCLNEDRVAMTPGTCFSATDVFVLSEGQTCNLGSTPALCDVGAACLISYAVAPCEPPAQFGGACQLAVPDMCPEGEFCNLGYPNCQPLPGAGDPCATGFFFKSRCQAYLRCVNDVCRPLGDNGDPCGVPAECYSGTCAGGECVPSACQ